MAETAQDPSMRVSTPEQHKALGHPLRQRLLFSLARQSATTSQLAAALGVAKGSIGHHLKILREAGLVRVVETRQVRGGTEQYYRRTALRMDIDDPTGGSTKAAFAGFADELTAAEDPLMILRHLRLTPEQAARLTAALTEIAESAIDDGPDQPSYGLLVAMYRKSPAPAHGHDVYSARASAGPGLTS
ncbi:winged helix-turn-helix domain-containing protein [Streptomyces sp. NPDC052107]|uniref:ArsR/SmtB family transcription factor n=1 Tax=Streptomyces sp. NPDC052107 TaxID=3155632 RepID=UPI003431DFBA